MLVRETIPAIDKTIGHVIAVKTMESVRELLQFTNAIDLVYNVDDFKNKKYLLNYKGDKEIRANKMDVSYEETSSESSLYFKPIFNKNKPFINDRDLVVKPVYIQTLMTLNFKVISKSRTDINQIADRLYRISMEGFTLNHHYRYLYYLNKTISYIALFIHKYRTDYGLITDEFIDFLTSISSTELKMTFDNSGRPANVAYDETLTNVSGLFKDINSPRVEFDKDTGYWTIDFSYEVEYSKLTYVDIFYNYVIANQFLPKVMIPEDKSIYKNSDTTMFSDMSKFKLSEPLFKQVVSSIMSNSYIKIPKDDVDSNLEKQKFVHTIISGLTLISPDDKRSLIDLNNLGDISFTDDVLEFIKREGSNILEPGMSVFQITLYKDNKLSGIPLTIDENLIVSAVDDLDLNCIYRIGIGLVNNVFYLKKSAYERYREFRVDIYKDLINEDRPEIDYVNGHLVVLENFFVYDIYNESLFLENRPIMKTVLTSHVLAMLKDK